MDETMRPASSIPWVAFTVALAGMSASSVSAQCTPGGPPSPTAAKGTIAGIVMDTSHRVIEDVDVITRDPVRKVKTDVRGRFQLTDVKTGQVEVTVRKIGYEIAVQTIAVTDSGGIARFCLIPEPRALPAIISSVARGGISGVVGDSTYEVLRGAEVRAVAGGEHAVTDSAGGFFLDLKAGTYVLTVKKEGYGTQFISVTIPKDSGRQVAVWLASPPHNPVFLEQALEAMRTRVLLAKQGGAFDAPGSPNRARMVSSEQLAKNPGDLASALQAAASSRIDPNCEVVVDGGLYSLPLSMIDKENVAFAEIYLEKPTRGGVNSMPTANKSTTAIMAPKMGIVTSPCGIFVWMKP
jgi:hypothetical protein